MIHPMTQPMTDDLTRALAARVPEGTIRPISPAYLEEPRGKWQGGDAVLALPGATEAVSEILRFAAEHGVGIVPRGGGTGLVGGQVMPGDARPIVLSLERMTAVRAVYPSENVLVAEAGAVLADIQNTAEAAERLFPLSLGSQGTARIGGLLSTNAGGVGVLRYGNARDLTLGIEAVLPDGSVFHGLKRLRKDNTGYDLRHLLIGAEGTLGVITAAALRLFPRPAETGLALMVVPSPAAALDLLGLAGDMAGPGLSAFELISGQGLRFLAETGLPVRQPFPEPPDWMALVDLGLTEGASARVLLERLFEQALGAGLVSDGLVAQSEGQRREIWAMRETIPEANRLIGAIASHDISLPLTAIPEFLQVCGAALAQLAEMRMNCFGHLGDGNLHYNLYPVPGKTKADYAHLAAQVSRVVHDTVARFDGSFSAEHGVGRLKVGDLERYGDPAKLSAMKAIKAALDPSGIMNPGAVLAMPG